MEGLMNSLAEDIPRLGRLHYNNTELLLRLKENVGSLESKIIVLEGSGAITEISRPVRKEKCDGGALDQFEFQQDEFRGLVDKLDLVVEMLNRII